MKVVPELIKRKKIQNFDLLSIFKIAIASGASGLDLKGAHSAASLHSHNGIPLKDYLNQPLDIDIYNMIGSKHPLSKLTTEAYNLGVKIIARLSPGTTTTFEGERWDLLTNETAQIVIGGQYIPTEDYKEGAGNSQSRRLLEELIDRRNCLIVELFPAIFNSKINKIDPKIFNAFLTSNDPDCVHLRALFRQRLTLAHKIMGLRADNVSVYLMGKAVETALNATEVC